MSKNESLGQFEQLVLTAVVAVQDEDAPYGMMIHEKVEQLSGKRAALGAVYITLDRMEAKGYLESWQTEPTNKRGGKSKRCYRLRALGQRVLSESANTSRRVLEEIEKSSGFWKWRPGRAKSR
jgi:DNA-binding PadR family transcriptional regulator